MAENTLTQWLTEEQEIRARQPADGRYPDTFAQYQHRPGIDYLQAIINGRCPQPPICATLDFLLLHVEPGVAVFQGEPLARLPPCSIRHSVALYTHACRPNAFTRRSR